MNEHKQIMCNRCKKPVEFIEAVDVFEAPNTFTVRVHCHGEVEQRTFNTSRGGLLGLMLAKTLYVTAFKTDEINSDVMQSAALAAEGETT